MNIKLIIKKLSPILTALMAFICIACEEVITIDLNKADPKIVIEGTITDKSGPYTVRITKTTDFYNPENPSAVIGAKVIISDDQGFIEHLTEDQSGVYRTNSLQGTPGRTYTLEVVTIDNKVYKAVSKMPSKATEIDSIYYTTGTTMDFYTDFDIICAFQDRPKVEDYCRIKYIISTDISDPPEYLLYNGRLSDGKRVKYEILLSIDQNIKKTKIDIELNSIDKATYKYYSTLADVVASDPKGLLPSYVPANPSTNLSNGALGYFSAFTTRRDTITLN